ncbi:hypothetical protein HOU03_gp334 [Caulobacter phage CcrSC]|uniref:Uncharacterized protein n=1 Tax=Caulobacter phage CcrSC TaxID=2283272 RepID=A0A385EDH4_9CAUD|nr:hypothetical protein HOU03_gp334 [Caulobacter phage CcrSC]AXQ69934.1 hypothetical protein CcrSC_gp352 [Caulobacter phage CcrSC]
MADPVRTLRIIVEETVTRAYDLSVDADPSHFAYVDALSYNVSDPDVRYIPAALKGYLSKGGEPVELPVGLRPSSELTRITKVTQLACDDGEPFHKIVRTPSTISAGPVRAKRKR